jgi:lysyl-tRNA synthetase class 1
MAQEVFRYPIPGRYEYEWIQIKGRGAMSSSKGIILLPRELLEIMPPDALRRMVLGRDPGRALDLDLSESFPRFMDEYRADTEENPVPFAHLVTVAQTVGNNVGAAVEMLQRGGYEEVARDEEKLGRDLAYARNWVERWAPESYRFGVREDVPPEAAELDADQRGYLREVSRRLEPEMDGDSIQDLLYSTAVEIGVKPKRAFAAVYAALLGKKSGPKAGPFVAGLDVGFVRERFSLVSGDTEGHRDGR